MSRTLAGRDRLTNAASVAAAQTTDTLWQAIESRSVMARMLDENTDTLLAGTMPVRTALIAQCRHDLEERL